MRSWPGSNFVIGYEGWTQFEDYVVIEACSPFRFMLLEDFPFGVVANDFGVDEPTQIKALRSELSHKCSVGGMAKWKVGSRR